MPRFSLSHLANQSLLLALAELNSRDRATTAELLAHISEVDARKLYARAGYPSMFAYCVGQLGMSDDVAAMRIRVSRVARRYPAIFPALADGRLHLTAVVLLAPHLNEANAAELLKAAAHRTKTRIELLLAERFPRPDLPSLVLPIAPNGMAAAQHVPERVRGELELASERVEDRAQHVPERVAEAPPLGNGEGASIRPRLTPLAPQRYALQCTLDQEAHENLLRAQALLGHAIPRGDFAKVIGHALKLLVRSIEKRKFGATEKPRDGGRTNTPSSGSGHIPAHVRRAVRERDGEQCSFVSEAGHRCEAREFLEFDHAVPVAKGGRSTVANLRLRCRAHNQFEAERAFGVEFMSRKRLEARSQRAEARDEAVAEQARKEAAEKARAAAEQVRAAAEAHAATERARQEVVPWLRRLGFRAEEARRAATLAATEPGAPLEERVRQALRHLAPPVSRTANFAMGPV